MMNGEAAYFIQFEMQGDTFRYVEPVMQPHVRNPANERAAKVQAAASLKHAIKARINQAVRHGARRAFLDSLLLPNGQVAYQQDNETLMRLFSSVTRPELMGGIIEGEIVE